MFTILSRTRKHVRFTFQPALESFEERALLSTVTNLNDSGDGSLRAAILAAEPGEVIDFAEGVQGILTLTTGQLTLNKNVSIYGPGQDLLSINGNGAACGQNACDRRVFDVAFGVTVELTGMRITGGAQTTPVTTADDVYAFGGGIYNAGTLYLTDVTVSGNRAFAQAYNTTGRVITANAYGGGLFNSGTALVTRATFVSNSATVSWTSLGDSRMASDGYGGAIDNAGTLALVDSTIGAVNRANEGVGYGGGIHNSGQATIVGSTIAHNDARNGGGIIIPGLTRYSFGGGVANIRGSMIVVNSTITANTARNGVFSAGGLSVASGGGLYNLGELNLINVTVANNRLTANGLQGAAGLGRGAGVFVDPAFPHPLRLMNSVLANNTLYLEEGAARRLGPDAFGRFASGGTNLIGRTDGSTGWTGADLTGTIANPLDARLAALGDNGGVTQTMRPVCYSPLLDAGNGEVATDFDQRGDGFGRVRGYYVPEKPVIDIGAYEVQSAEDCEPITGPSGAGSEPLPLYTADLVQALERVGERQKGLR